MRVSTGRLTVGEANLYSLSSLAMLQQELANAFADSSQENRKVALERQRQARETLRYSSQILQSARESGRPARCQWIGNVLQCSSD
jgi:hypothetical protein